MKIKNNLKELLQRVHLHCFISITNKLRLRHTYAKNVSGLFEFIIESYTN